MTPTASSVHGAMGGRPSTSEIAVVGASVAGIYAALLLAKRGYEVAVYERAPELDPALRTLIVTSKMHDHLDGLGAGSVLNQIDTFELNARARQTTLQLSRPDLIIERAALIRGLAKAAADEGVTFHYGHRFERVGPGALGIELSFKRGSCEQRARAQVVIGADGARSIVARSAGMRLQPTAPLLQALVELPDQARQNVSRIWFRTEETPYFYWLIPDSQSVGALGVIGSTTDRLRENLDKLARQEGYRTIGYQGARIPIYSGWLPQSKSFGKGRVYLVGDAAGHVKVSTVGGLVTGVRGALAAVEDICGERTGATASLRTEMYLHLVVRKALHRWSDEQYERLLMGLNSSSHEVLSRLSRDEMPQLMWRLAVAQPKLLAHAVRGLPLRRLTR